jgi:hypothetical protein
VPKTSVHYGFGLAIEIAPTTTKSAVADEYRQEFDEPAAAGYGPSGMATLVFL